MKVEYLDKRVLSIQSHVVHGYVGNKSATFPLQLLGFEVDGINSGQYSNHSYYAHFKGTALNGDQLEEIFNTLSLNKIDVKYTHILTGYCSNPDFLDKVFNIVQCLKKNNTKLVYVCDPVLGDRGKYYVPKEEMLIYKNKLIPLADIITPNQFEAEQLTNITIKNNSDINDILDTFHSKGVFCVIITSIDLNGKYFAIGSMLNHLNKSERWKLEMSKLYADFAGTGDLFSALILAWLDKTNNNLKEALEKTISVMQSILKKTYNYAINTNDMNAANFELRIIQSRFEIEQPTCNVEATLFSSA